MSEIIKPHYNPLLHAGGLPYQLTTRKPFELKKALRPFETPKVVCDARKQVKMFDMACNDEPGWLGYFCSEGYLDYPRMLAAHVMQCYFDNGYRGVWLTQFDNLKGIRFRELNIVVIDALFFDSSAYRRDKIYEVINYDCNVKNLSVCIVGQHNQPLELAKKLGLKAHIALLTK